MRADLAFRVFAVFAFVAVPNFVVLTPVQAQVRGVYPVGMNATNSGVTPEAGITYSNLFVFFSRDEEKGPHGEILATGQNSIMMDMNSFVWVSKKEMGLLGGAIFSACASSALPFGRSMDFWRPPEDLVRVLTRMLVQVTGPQSLRVDRRYIWIRAKPLPYLPFRCMNFTAPKRTQWSTQARPLTSTIR